MDLHHKIYELYITFSSVHALHMKSTLIGNLYNRLRARNLIIIIFFVHPVIILTGLLLNFITIVFCINF